MTEKHGVACVGKATRLTIRLIVRIVVRRWMGEMKMSDKTLELLWSMLTDEQLMELRENGEMDDRTMQSFKTELFKRCLIEFGEAMAAFF